MPRTATPFQHPEAPRIRAAILREIKRKGVVPLRALRVRIYLYSNLAIHWKGIPAVTSLPATRRTSKTNARHAQRITLT